MKASTRPSGGLDNHRWHTRGDTALGGHPAVMNQAEGPLGFLTPRLYQIYQNPAQYAEAFRDITVGGNSFGGISGYQASAGWDAGSGPGTPDAAGLAAAL